MYEVRGNELAQSNDNLEATEKALQAEQAEVERLYGRLSVSHGTTQLGAAQPGSAVVQRSTRCSSKHFVHGAVFGC